PEGQAPRFLVLGIGIWQRGADAHDRRPSLQQQDNLRGDEDRQRADAARDLPAARPTLRRASVYEYLRAPYGLRGYVRERDHAGPRQDLGRRATGYLRRRLAGVRLHLRR